MKRRTKRISLAFMGDAWRDAYIESRLVRQEDIAATEAMDADTNLTAYDRSLKAIKLYFVGGKGPNDNDELVDLTPDDMDDLDVFSAAEIVSQLGFPDPKASETSMTTSPEMAPSPGDSSNSSTGNDLDSAPTS